MARRPAHKGEFERIALYFRPLAARLPGADRLTDDAYVFSPPPGSELVVTSDAMVAGVHFLASDHPADIAAKLLAVNLSDLAAKGAAPLSYQLSLALPPAWGESWLAQFSAGLAAGQARYGLGLSGGDSVRIDGPAVLSITVIGHLPRGGALRRRGARAGDLLAVSGTIGDAALGLDVVLNGLSLPDADARSLVRRLRRPTPRLALAAWLRAHATAALDVSDGLAADCGHLAAASGLTAVIERGSVPLSPAARRALADPALWPRILAGGDDYEIALAMPPGTDPASAPVPLTVIGRLEPAGETAVRILDDAGQPVPLASTGWKHA